MAENKEQAKELCHLQKATGIDAWCTREKCIYWRLIETQDLDLDEADFVSNKHGCGLQHYRLVENLSPEMADWLVSMKRRLENTSPEVGKSRITFRRREQE